MWGGNEESVDSQKDWMKELEGLGLETMWMREERFSELLSGLLSGLVPEFAGERISADLIRLI